MWVFRKKFKWPELSWDEIKKRARLLVIDDLAFPYQKLFERDGYTIEKWDDVLDLPKLENGYYDLILLDMRDVGRQISKAEGLGVLKHLRQTAPAQIIVAYSDSDFSLEDHEFFVLADAVLAKNAGYIEFKMQVDKLLRERFSIGFYIDRAVKAAGTSFGNIEKARRIIQDAIERRSTDRLAKYLDSEIQSKDIVNMILQIVQIAIGIAAL